MRFDCDVLENADRCGGVDGHALEFDLNRVVDVGAGNPLTTWSKEGKAGNNLHP